MSYEESLQSITLNADASIGIYTGVPGLPGSANPNSGNQYRIVKVTGANTAGLSTAAGDPSVGVLQNKPQQVGSAATVGIHGVSNIVVGAAFSAGDNLISDGEGRAITSAAPATDVVVGVALADGVTVGSIVPVLLKV